MPLKNTDDYRHMLTKYMTAYLYFLVKSQNFHDQYSRPQIVHNTSSNDHAVMNPKNLDPPT